MPKCNRCSIREECHVWKLKQADDKGVLHKICPLVWVIVQHIKVLPTEKEYLEKKPGLTSPQTGAISGVLEPGR